MARRSHRDLHGQTVQRPVLGSVRPVHDLEAGTPDRASAHYVVVCDDIPDLFEYPREATDWWAEVVSVPETTSGVEMLILLLLESVRTGRFRRDRVNALPL